MKFRKEYQTYLLIVIAIITAGYYFLNPFFFNKKKKVIEGQAGTTTYYRIAFNSTDLSKLLNTAPPTPTQEDLLKELILTQYDTVLTDATGIQYVKPDTKYDGLMMNLIPATLLMKDSLGLKVAACTGNKLDFFNKEAAAAAVYSGDATATAAAAAAAYDYSRLILSNTYKDEIAFKKEAAAAADTADATAAAAAYEYARLNLSNTYKDDVNIKALIAAANFLTIMTQPTLADIYGARNANTSAYRAATNASAKDTGVNAGGAHTSFTSNKNFAGAATLAATAAAHADAYAKGLSSDSLTYIENNANYKKVLAKYYSNPANINAAFITAAGLIYQSVYEKINKTGIMALIAAADFLTFIGQPDIKYNDPRIGTTSATVSAAASAAANYAPMAYSAAANTANITRNLSLWYDSWGYESYGDKDQPASLAGTNAAKAAGYADAYAKGQSVDDNTVTSNANYRLIKEGAGGRQGSNMVNQYNLKAKFIQAAGLIYKSVYEKINKI